MLFELGAVCIDALPVPRGATGVNSVVEPGDVVLPARNTDGSIFSGRSGAVPKGGEGGVEDDDDGRDRDGRSADVNIDCELDTEGAALSDACSP